MNLSNIAILSIQSVDYCCIINRVTKNEAKHLLQNVDMTEKSRTL